MDILIVSLLVIVLGSVNIIVPATAMGWSGVNVILVVAGLYLAYAGWRTRSGTKAKDASEEEIRQLEGRLREIQGRAGRVPELEHEVARLPALERQAARAEELEAEVERLRVEAHAAETQAGERLKAAQEFAEKAADAEVLSLLALLQEKGRFLDFIMDDVSKYPDAQVGAAARVVHQGCSQVISESFDIRPIFNGQEGAALTLGRDYDAHRFRVVGRVSGEPPFKGRVLHRGWLTTGVKLPERIDTAATTGYQDAGIIQPAEVELS